ncbi:hypothetical protein RFI_26785 [Reticulomyxa filosa]|uniref:Uncharacterized protein n=1 Tax=Reticulomyxa filosa TaxID=46433 RepID=X6MA92_RETFI|nr:hypothetical protein RFI_26785 [Reticulomyxa filosa]|eukprot:ETO10591.1 hypothetical protein RFI_26785 [Reticulomyxa filosa]
MYIRGKWLYIVSYCILSSRSNKNSCLIRIKQYNKEISLKIKKIEEEMQKYQNGKQIHTDYLKQDNITKNTIIQNLELNKNICKNKQTKTTNTIKYNYVDINVKANKDKKT